MPKIIKSCPFTLGRKNWLFSDTPKGADASAVVYTMVEMAKAHGLNVYKYLNYLLEHLPDTKMTDEALSKHHGIRMSLPGALVRYNRDAGIWQIRIE